MTGGGVARLAPLKFVHCADLHLDSPFECMDAASAFVAATLREATFKAFENVISLAIAEKVDFIVIAGDVYDGVDRSLRAQLRFRDAVVRAVDSGIWCFIVHGNHDPLSGWEVDLRLPEKVVRFADSVRVASFKRGGDELAKLYGVSYRSKEVSENLARSFRREDDTVPAIGVLHCNVGGQTDHENYAPCSLDDLRETGIDYWALGHVHKPAVINRNNPCAVYSGTTQGRSVRECGPHGCYLVELDDSGQAFCAFVETDVVRWWSECLDITDMNSVDDMLDRTCRRIEEIRAAAGGRPSIVRLRLLGRGPIHGLLGREEVLPDLLEQLRKEEGQREDFVWVESIYDDTGSAIDVEAYRQARDFVGEFLRRTAGLRSGPDTANALRELIAENWGSEYSRVRRWLSDERLLTALDRAEKLALDLLLKEESR